MFILFVIVIKLNFQILYKLVSKYFKISLSFATYGCCHTCFRNKDLNPALSIYRYLKYFFSCWLFSVGFYNPTSAWRKKTTSSLKDASDAQFDSKQCNNNKLVDLESCIWLKFLITRHTE